jgi:hypothetical protein
MQRPRPYRGRRALPQLRRLGPRGARRRRRLIARVLLSGTAASAASALAAAFASRLENGHAARPVNAIAHIHDGGAPPARDRHGRNTAVGFLIHTAASVWWALFFESLPRKHRNPAGAAAISALAYVVDYHIVHPRFRPGFEAHLSAPSIFATYAALAAGYAFAARLERGLDDHQEEDCDEGDESRPAERGPHAVKAPEPLRQGSA